MWLLRSIGIFITTTLVCSVALGCMMSRGFENPRVSFDRNLYVFVGEVIGETDILESKKVIGKAKGMKVRPLDIVHVPMPTADYYEFFRFGVTPWCADSGAAWTYPVGTRLRIIAKEADLVPNRSRDGHVRLQARMLERTSIDHPVGGVTTSSGYVYDYSNKLPSFFLKPTTSDDYLARSAFSDFYYVEVSKDLLRLESAKSEPERLAILERLLFCPTVDFHRLIDPTFDSTPPNDPTTGKPQWKRQKGTKKLSNKEKHLVKERDRLEELNLLPDARLLK